MYVVRLDLPDREPDYKAFSALPSARERLRLGAALIPEGGLDAALLFEVPGAVGPREAVNAVKQGEARLLDRDPWPELDRAARELIDEWINAGKLTPG